MKPIKINLVLAAGAIIATLYSSSLAQSTIRPSVVGNGGTTASNSSYILSGTAGQPLIGVASNPAQRNEAGFWYQAGWPTGNNLNRPPVVIQAIANQNLVIGGAAFTIDLNTVFRDPDGDFLLYAAVSSDPSKATAAVSGGTLTIAAVAIGSTKITVTADDQKGGTAVTDFMVTVLPPPNQPPVVANPIPNQTLTVGNAPFIFDLDAVPAVFSDPDNDVLSYTAASSDPSKATATVSGSSLTVAPLAAGNSMITVTANDNKGGTAFTTFTVTVNPPPNRPPMLANAIPNQILTVGNASFIRDLNAAPVVFSDPDNDVLSYTATSSDPSKATATIVGSTLTVVPVAAGSATITVTANDNKGGTAQTTFAITVNPPSPRYTLVASPSTVAPGAQLRVDWTAPSGSSPKDWIGLYKIGAPNTGYLWWQYTQGAASGKFTLTAPVQPGEYEFRYLLNDGYTEAARSNVVTVNAPTICWTEDFFDNLSLGSLAGQNGWYTVTGSYAAGVVVNPGGAGKVLQLDPPAGAKVFMAKNIGAALSGTQSLELKVRVEQPGSASMAKLEVNTNNNTFWDKKFQLYFGSSMRLNNSPSTAINFVSQTVPQRWYQIKVIFDLSTNIADLYLDGVLVLNDVVIGAGSISGIAVTGFDDPGYALLDDIRGCTGGLLKASSGHAEETVAAMPSSFELGQNYPNPFNPETTIQYAIPSHVSGPVRVTLRIYNLQGQLVRTLVDEQKSPGQYRVVWDGKNDLGARIATGMYLYTITVGDFKATKRMTILK